MIFKSRAALYLATPWMVSIDSAWMPVMESLELVAELELEELKFQKAKSIFSYHIALLYIKKWTPTGGSKVIFHDYSFIQ
jgi:hypothetical protein